MASTIDFGRIISGAAGGFAATAPMTAAMIAMHKLLPPQHRYALPPRHITLNVADALAVKHHMSERQRDAATLVAHFGYGSAMGGIFATLADQLPAPPVASGVAWGLFVWAASYLGVLPMLDLHEPATDHPAERNVLMILAHVVWGATLGWLAQIRRSR